MIKFSHIGQLPNVVQTVRARHEAGAPLEPIQFRGTVKLHGSNAAVVRWPDGLRTQSRNREITPSDDNLGFAAWALSERRHSAFAELSAELCAAHGIAGDRPLALFGEWIGPGVQKGVGVSQLGERQFVVFAVATHEPDAEHNRYLELPALGDRFAELGVYSIADGPQLELELDFRDRAALELAAERIELATAAIDARCPWAARFGVEGVGEGIVWQPIAAHFGDSELLFKSKGSRHQIVARDRSQSTSRLDPAELADVEAFVGYAVTEQRLAQGLDYLREQGMALELRSLGPYLAWLAGDIRRECAAELERSALAWGQVARAINEVAKNWFRGQLDPLG